MEGPALLEHRVDLPGSDEVGLGLGQRVFEDAAQTSEAYYAEADADSF
jgi:hypothetical protein